MQEQPNGATGGSSATQHLRAAAESAYQNKADSLLSGENCYKVVIVSTMVNCEYKGWFGFINVAYVSVSFVLLWFSDFRELRHSSC